MSLDQNIPPGKLDPLILIFLHGIVQKQTNRNKENTYLKIINFTSLEFSISGLRDLLL